MKTKIYQSILLMSLLIFLISCEGNLIYYDKDKQSIKSKNKWDTDIRNIEIKNDSLNINYNIYWVEKGIAQEVFSLDKINDGYKITTNGVKLIPNKEFKLIPNVHYEVTNYSDGDAGSCKIKIFYREK